MPTPSGLPKVGEVWERTIKLPPDGRPFTYGFVVLERGRGDYWSLTVHVRGRAELWAHASYWLRQGELRYIGAAGPKTKKRLGLG